jgi:hypothetical protein
MQSLLASRITMGKVSSSISVGFLQLGTLGYLCPPNRVAHRCVVKLGTFLVLSRQLKRKEDAGYSELNVYLDSLIEQKASISETF